jgi:hypothetical protein
MKDSIKRGLSLRTHSIRDLTAEDLRLAIGGKSGSAGSGSAGGGHAASGSGRDGSYGGRSGFLSS